MWAAYVLVVAAVLAAACGNLPLVLLLLLLLLGVVLCSEPPAAACRDVVALERQKHAGDEDIGPTVPMRVPLHSTQHDPETDLNQPYYESQMQRNLVNAPLPTSQQRQQFTAFLADGFCAQKDQWMVEDKNDANDTASTKGAKGTAGAGTTGTTGTTAQSDISPMELVGLTRCGLGFHDAFAMLRR